jgi:phosphoglycolate phosphatase-like HAD superfamily hydrolase
MKALIFDLDGTLADSTYQHVIAWQRAFASIGVHMPAVEIHRRIGMNGTLLVQALDRAFDLRLTSMKRHDASAAHDREYQPMRDDVRLFDEADSIGRVLGELGVRWSIVTSAKREQLGSLLDRLNVTCDTLVVTGDDEQRSKPAAHPFSRAIDAMGLEPHDAGVVGDSVWDMLASRQAGCFGIGVLTGGYGREELAISGAFRVYRDVAQLLAHLEEVGVEPPG